MSLGCQLDLIFFATTAQYKSRDRGGVARDEPCGDLALLLIIKQTRGVLDRCEYGVAMPVASRGNLFASGFTPTKATRCLTVQRKTVKNRQKMAPP